MSSESAKRQCAWLERGARQAGASSWRPVVLHRVSAKRWCMNIDNDLQVSTHFGGLRHFQVDDRPVWHQSQWRSWPTIFIPMDLGPDGQSGMSALEYKFRLCVLKCPDPSHGLQRDQWVVLKDMHLFQWWLLMMVSVNMPYGPRQSEERLTQFRNLCIDLHGKNPRAFPLFMARVPGALRDLRDAGVELPGEGDPEQELWEYWLQRGHFRRSGYRCNLNRFQGGFVRVANDMQHWELDLWESEYVAIEMDMMKSKRLLRHMVDIQYKDTAVPAEEGQALKQTVHIEDKALKGVADNAIIIRILMLGNAHHKRLTKLILEATKHIVAFHHHQSTQLRSAEKTREWLQHMAGQGFMEHIWAGLQQLSNTESLERCEFHLPCEGEAVNPDHESDLILEDDFAQRYGQLNLGYAAARMRRIIFYQSWPWRLYRGGKSVEDAQQVLNALKKDSRVYEIMKDLEGKTAKEKQ
jgi:hypothetical protein